MKKRSKKNYKWVTAEERKEIFSNPKAFNYGTIGCTKEDDIYYFNYGRWLNGKKTGDWEAGRWVYFPTMPIEELNGNSGGHKFEKETRLIHISKKRIDELYKKIGQDWRD